MAIVQARSGSPWRISITRSVAPSTTASNYTVTRADGGSVSGQVASAFLRSGDPFTVELVLAAPLVDGIIYIVAVSGDGSIQIAYRAPLIAAQLPAQATGEDPEAEVLGEDADWIFAEGLDSSGDLPTLRGRQAMREDLVTAAYITPGELFHRPKEGAGLVQRVNGPAIPGQLQAMRSSVLRQWYKDDRVAPNGIVLDIGVSGAQTTIDSRVQSISIDEPLTIKTPLGSG